MDAVAAPAPRHVTASIMQFSIRNRIETLLITFYASQHTRILGLWVFTDSCYNESRYFRNGFFDVIEPFVYEIGIGLLTHLVFVIGGVHNIYTIISNLVTQGYW